MPYIFNIKKKNIKVLVFITAVILIIATAAGCLKNGKPGETNSDITSKVSEVTSSDTNETTTTETKTTEEPENKNPVETEAETDDSPINDFDKITSSTNSDNDGNENNNSETNNPVAAELVFGVNPLTGINTGLDYNDKRPVAIMINNLKQSLPQVGISQADVMYECLVEGGTTRLMMVLMDYETLDTVGSVRSARDYYIDLAQNHDAIFVHAGGSDDAYKAIKERKISNLDGVNMSLPATFYRDSERAKIMSIEHTLMTDGEGIVSGINNRRYRTSLRSGFISPFNFPEENSKYVPDGKDARHVIVTYNNTQFPQYIYNSVYNQYTRYQFNGLDHIDGETGDKLRFTNVIILVCAHSSANDDLNHINITTTGSGKGYYIYGGKYTEIKWSKSTVDSNIKFTDTFGNPLVINRGNTMINIVSPSVDRALIFDYD